MGLFDKLKLKLNKTQPNFKEDNFNPKDELQCLESELGKELLQTGYVFIPQMVSQSKKTPITMSVKGEIAICAIDSQKSFDEFAQMMQSLNGGDKNAIMCTIFQSLKPSDFTLTKVSFMDAMRVLDACDLDRDRIFYSCQKEDGMHGIMLTKNALRELAIKSKALGNDSKSFETGIFGSEPTYGRGNQRLEMDLRMMWSGLNYAKMFWLNNVNDFYAIGYVLDRMYNSGDVEYYKSKVNEWRMLFSQQTNPKHITLSIMNEIVRELCMDDQVPHEDKNRANEKCDKLRSAVVNTFSTMRLNVVPEQFVPEWCKNVYQDIAQDSQKNPVAMDVVINDFYMLMDNMWDLPGLRIWNEAEAGALAYVLWTKANNVNCDQYANFVAQLKSLAAQKNTCELAYMVCKNAFALGIVDGLPEKMLQHEKDTFEILQSSVEVKYSKKTLNEFCVIFKQYWPDWFENSFKVYMASRTK